MIFDVSGYVYPPFGISGCRTSGPTRSTEVLLRHASGVTATKRKISVSLDEDLIAELETGGEALSGQINEVVRAEIEGLGAIENRVVAEA